MPAGKVSVELAHNVIEPGLVMAGVPNGQVEQKTEKRALVVIRDAPFWAKIVGVFFQPRLAAGIFRTLEEPRRRVLKLLYLLCQPPIEIFPL